MCWVWRKTRFSGLFGYHLLTHYDNRVVLTTNERDTLVSQSAFHFPCNSFFHSVSFNPSRINIHFAFGFWIRILPIFRRFSRRPRGFWLWRCRTRSDSTRQCCPIWRTSTLSTSGSRTCTTDTPKTTRPRSTSPAATSSRSLRVALRSLLCLYYEGVCSIVNRTRTQKWAQQIPPFSRFLLLATIGLGTRQF